MKKNETMEPQVMETVEQAAPEIIAVVNKNAYRTASIEFLEVTVAYADFATKEFGEAKALYFDDVEASDEKILKDLCATTGKVYQAVISRNLCSGLFRIKNADYAKYGERIGEAREKKSEKI